MASLALLVAAGSSGRPASAEATPLLPVVGAAVSGAADGSDVDGPTLGSRASRRALLLPVLVLVMAGVVVAATAAARAARPVAAVGSSKGQQPLPSITADGTPAAAAARARPPEAAVGVSATAALPAGEEPSGPPKAAPGPPAATARRMAAGAGSSKPSPLHPPLQVSRLPNDVGSVRPYYELSHLA